MLFVSRTDKMVRIPLDLYENADRYVQAGGMGFTGVPELVRAAVREYLAKHDTTS